MNAIQQVKHPPSPAPAKPVPAIAKPKKILAYTQDELKRSIERKQKRKLELSAQIQKLDQKIAERQARLTELNKKVN